MQIKELIKDNWLLIIFLLFASVLRFWNLGNIPPHLTPDEASLGYNAYSILKTGKDEYGELLPIIFKSFGDFKPGFYIYLTVPSVILFGLTEFAVRFPSALAGIFIVFFIYLIVQKLFNKKVALFSVFIASITPWLIYFSRGAWEVNVSLCLTLGGIYFFLKGLERNKYIIHSTILFALTLVTYQGAKLSTGIAVLILLILYWKETFKLNKKFLLIAGVLGFIISAPIIFSFTQGKTGRLEVFSVFSYPRPKEVLEEFLGRAGEKVGDLKYYLYHSELLNFKRGILGRWFNHFSGRFLFFEGDWPNPRHSAPYQGMFLISDLLVLLVGFFAFIRNKLKREHLFVLLWLILAPLPSVLSRDQVHAVRALHTVVPFVIIPAFGLQAIFAWSKSFKKPLIRNLLFLFFFVIYLTSFIYFTDAYFVHVPKHDSQYWDYGYKQIVETVSPIQNNYKLVRMQQSFAQPYIYFLFFQKYDPASYQKQAKLVENELKGDVGHVEHLDNICFCPIDWSVNRGDRDTLFVADTIRIPPEDSKDETLFNLIREIKYLNNRDTAFRIIEVK